MLRLFEPAKNNDNNFYVQCKQAICKHRSCTCPFSYNTCFLQPIYSLFPYLTMKKLLILLKNIDWFFKMSFNLTL